MSNTLTKANPKINRDQFLFSARDVSIQLGHKTKLMGIINMSPDSFSADGLDSVDQAYNQALQMMAEGADMLDIGGESSRPGAEPISAQEEINRIVPVIQKISNSTNALISVDTYKPEAAKAALEAGAHIINNIKGTQIDKNLLEIVAHFNAGLILMHMQGSPKTMQENIQYTDVIENIMTEIKEAVNQSQKFGIKPDQIIIDPGIGFGKSVEHNLQILNRLKFFQTLEMPLLIGTSRKSFIGHVLDNDPSDRLAGTIGSVCAAVINGAHILRIHDIKPVKDAIAVVDSILNEQKVA